MAGAKRVDPVLNEQRPTSEVSGGRAYAGQDSASRRAARRARILEAATQLYGSPEGWSLATVERICSLAAVATRSVYEEFGSREALLLSVYQEVIDGAAAAIQAALDLADPDVAAHAHGAITAYVRYMTEDPRRAGIAHVSMRRAGDWAHTARLATMHHFAARIELTLQHLPGHDALREWDSLSAVMMAGAVDELIAHWFDASPQPTPDALINALVKWLTAYLSIGPDPADRALS